MLQWMHASYYSVWILNLLANTCTALCTAFTRSWSSTTDYISRYVDTYTLYLYLCLCRLIQPSCKFATICIGACLYMSGYWALSFATWPLCLHFNMHSKVWPWIYRTCSGSPSEINGYQPKRYLVSVFIPNGKLSMQLNASQHEESLLEMT